MNKRIGRAILWLCLFLGLGMATARAATLTVTKTADTNDNVCDADCSLREAITVANSQAGDDVIEFSSSAFAGTQKITLSSSFNSLPVTGGNGALTINGTGAERLAISGGNAVRVFSVAGLNANLTLNNLTVTEGKLISPATGGGINILSGTVTINNSIISNNTISGTTLSRGGGIANSGTLIINNSAISGNSVLSTGGTGTLFQGGGIYNSGGTLTVTNSTVSNNSSNTQGGGIFNDSSNSLTLTNSTVSGNAVTGSFGLSSNFLGGGIYNASGGTLNAVNTIISGNSALGSPDLSGSLSAGSTNNLVGGAAQLLPLGNYGGTTPTHALLPDSPAVNAGNDCVLTLSCPTATPPAALNTDQRGRGRIGTVDIGAFEAPANLVVTNTLDTGAGSLRNALAAANATATDESVTFVIPFSDAGCVNGVCTITLTSGELGINSAATAGVLFIQNTNGTAESMRVSGNNLSRVFFINDGANVSISGLTLTGGKAPVQNLANCASVACGGGIYNLGTLTLSNSLVNSSAAEFGGGILNVATLNLTNSAVSGNSVSRSGNSSGGGINNAGGTVNLTNSTVSGNSVNAPGGSAGGGGINNAGTFNLTNSTVSGNSVSGTIASRGGGIFINSGTANLTNSTVSNNSASGNSSGGGIINFTVANARNTIISGNSAAAGANLSGSLSTASENNVVDNEANVRLAPLGFYGGATLTHALLSGSTAVNAGNNCVMNQSCATFNAPVALPSDQRGAGRVGQVDIGAFEVNNSANGGTFVAQLPRATQGQPYSYTLVPNNGSFSYTQTGGTLPPNITLSTAFAAPDPADMPFRLARAEAGPQAPTAAVSLGGTPSQAGTYNFSITASDGTNTSITDYQLIVLGPTAAGVSVSGYVLTPSGRAVRTATVTLSDLLSGSSQVTRVDRWGRYEFAGVEPGRSYVVRVGAKGWSFAPGTQLVTVNFEVGDLNFTAVTGESAPGGEISPGPPVKASPQLKRK